MTTSSNQVQPPDVSRQPLDYATLAPEVIRELRGIMRRLGSPSIDPRLRALVELRVSQMNGCAYCIDLHAREAIAHQETTQRLLGLSAWRESLLFDHRERIALQWAEALTSSAYRHDHDGAFTAVQSVFPDEAQVQLTLMIALANAWNRIAGGLRRQPDPWPIHQS